MQCLQATTSSQVEEGSALKGRVRSPQALQGPVRQLDVDRGTRPENPKEDIEAKPEISSTVPKALVKAGSERLSALSSPPVKGANSL